MPRSALLGEKWRVRLDFTRRNRTQKKTGRLDLIYAYKINWKKSFFYILSQNLHWAMCSLCSLGFTPIHTVLSQAVVWVCEISVTLCAHTSQRKMVCIVSLYENSCPFCVELSCMCSECRTDFLHSHHSSALLKTVWISASITNT